MTRPAETKDLKAVTRAQRPILFLDEVYELAADAPECVEAQANKIIYLLSEKQFKYCEKDQGWQVVELPASNIADLSCKNEESLRWSQGKWLCQGETVGATGPSGGIGATGPKGADGAKGSKGATGAAGAQGAAGAKGALGAMTPAQKAESSDGFILLPEFMERTSTVVNP